MIRSMTGFGRAVAKQEFELSVEVKSVNSKFCDINVRLPRHLMLLEEHIRAEIRERLVRGKIDVYVNLSDTRAAELSVTPNFDLLDRYDRAFRAIEERYALSGERSLAQYLSISDALIVSVDESAQNEAYRSAVEAGFDSALEQLDAMRREEGGRLADDIRTKLCAIRDEVSELKKRAAGFPAAYEERLRGRIDELLAGSKQSVDERVLASEIAVMAERADIEEEIVRLLSHLDQMERGLNADEPIGRKLDFIAQEMLREANTMGSKFPDLQAVRHVIQIKSLIDQIKEQIQNIL